MRAMLLVVGVLAAVALAAGAIFWWARSMRAPAPPPPPKTTEAPEIPTSARAHLVLAGHGRWPTLASFGEAWSENVLTVEDLLAREAAARAVHQARLPEEMLPAALALPLPDPEVSGRLALVPVLMSLLDRARRGGEWIGSDLELAEEVAWRVARLPDGPEPRFVAGDRSACEAALSEIEDWLARSVRRPERLAAFSPPSGIGPGCGLPRDPNEELTELDRIDPIEGMTVVFGRAADGMLVAQGSDATGGRWARALLREPGRALGDVRFRRPSIATPRQVTLRFDGEDAGTLICDPEGRFAFYYLRP